MRFRSARLYHLAIPFRTSFGHSLTARERSSSVVVALETDSGFTGYGEGAPRTYVTGEDPASAMAHIRSTLLPVLRGRVFPETGEVGALTVALEEVTGNLPASGTGAVIAFHAAKCAVELAIIDALLQRHGLSAGAICPPAVAAVTYSAVIGLGTVGEARRVALRCREAGIQHIKVKVGGRDDHARVTAIREIVGDGVSLRIDANGAFDLPSAVALARLLEPLRVDCVEQPFPRSLSDLSHG